MTAPGTQAEIELAVDEARRPDVVPASPAPPLQESPDDRPAAAMSHTVRAAATLRSSGIG